MKSRVILLAVLLGLLLVQALLAAEKEFGGGGIVYGEGHAHVYVDDYLLSRAYSEWYHLPNLKPGTHTVYVTLNGNDHTEYISGNTVVGAHLSINVE